MDAQSDADKIRLKRLEKLQAAQAAAQQDQQASASSGATTNGADGTRPPKTSSNSVATPTAGSSSSAATPAAKRPQPVAAGSASGAGTASKSSASVTPPAKQASSSGPSSSAATPKPRTPQASTPTSSTPSTSAASAAALQIPFPQWFSAVISRIFGFTLSRTRAESSSWQITYLYSLHAELSEEQPIAAEADAAMRFDEDNLERAIVARLSMDPEEEMADAEDDPVKITVLASLPAKLTNLEYLVQCWKRWPAERNKLGQPKTGADELSRRIKATEFIKRKILESIGLQLQEPTLFPQPSNRILGGQELLPPLLQLQSLPASPFLALETHQLLSLLADIASVYSTPTSSADLVDVLGTPFLQVVVDKLGAKQGTIQAMLAQLNAGGSQEGIMDLTGMDWRNVVRAVNDLTEVKPLANMLVDMPNWCPAAATANTFEVESLMGPVMRLGCFPDAFPSICKAYFAQPSALSQEAINASSNALRSTLSTLQQLLFGIFNSIVRSSSASREGVLALFSHIIKLNTRRDGMRVDRRTVSSDGLMINSLSVLQDFCAPFMDATFSKIDKIDPEYLRKCRGRIDVKEVTKMHATLEEAKEFYDEYTMDGSAPPPNFISEIFYLTSSFMHYALYPALSYHEALHRHLRNQREDLQEAEQNRQYDGTPQEGPYRSQVERMKKEVDAFHSRVLASEVQLLDPAFIAKCGTFASFVMTWLVRLVDPKGKHPHTIISLDGLPEETPLAFRMLPEYIVEDVTEFYFFVSRYAPQTMIDMEKDQLLVFIIVFLCTPYINNPYLKGKFVEILYRNTRSWGPRFPRGTMGDTLNYHPLALKGLLPSLMVVYCQIEFTGQHNQFYEKFEVRHQIAKILKLIWETKEHREAFKGETGRPDFVRFVNFLLNDTTFMLDESLSKLKVIHDIQMEMADKATWEAQTEEARKDREKLLKQSEGTATSFFIYSYEVLHLLKTLTAESPHPFLVGEIVDRLAASLDFNLNVLAGPRCQELKVQDREKYRFRPRDLLGDIMQIIINLADKQAYVLATAKDGRSYSKGLFDNAIRISARAGIKTESQLGVLRKMVDKIEALKAAEAEEEEMGETPDEYLDPLTADIMVDPVILPASGTVIDFNTIKQHLLTTAQDPFNRTPLKIEDVIRNDDLKAEIEAFRAKRKQERLDRLAAAQQEQSEKMEE